MGKKVETFHGTSLQEVKKDIYFCTDVNFKGYNGSDPFNCQILNTKTAATVSHTQEKDKIIPAKGMVCQ